MDDKKRPFAEEKHEPFGQNNMTNSVILVLVLVGLPASGKSTIARSLVTLAAKRQQEEEQNADNCCLSTSLHYIEYDGVQESIMTTGDECISPVKESSKNGSHEKEDGYDDDEDSSSSLLEAWRRSRLMALDRLGDILQENQKKTEKQCHKNDDTESSSSSSSSSFTVVLLDDNFHLRSMRKQVYQTCQQAMTNMATNNNDTTAEENNCMVNNDGGGKSSSSHVQRDYTIFFGSVYINTPLEVCLERNRLRRERQQQQQVHLTTSSPSVSSSSSSRHSIVQQVSDETILRMSRALEPPAVGSKASWEVDGAILTLNGSRPIDDLVQEFEQYIQVFYQASSQSLVAATAVDVPVSLPPPVRAMVDPAIEQARLDEERRKTRECFQHQLELSSRQWVAAVARIRPQHARVANQIRKEMLASFQQEENERDQRQASTELQKGKAATTTVVTLTDQDGNSTRSQATTNAETVDMLRRQFAEKVWNSTMSTTTWTDEEKNQLWIELSS